MSYDHDDWLELRLDIEKFIWKIADLMRYFDNYNSELYDSKMPINVITAENAISDHETLRSKIMTLSVDRIEEELQQVNFLFVFFY